MAELRRDPVVGRWVIVNTDDSLHPQDFEKEEHVFRQADVCQFCYGRERHTPPEVDVIRPSNTPANTAGWSVRVIPNKFPALRIEGELNKRGLGIFDISNGVGAHEVVIETPEHFKKFADLSEAEMLNVIKKYQSRFISLSGDRRFKYIMIFKNYGESAGASMEHAHSQIIALQMVPKYVLEELEGAQQYFNFRGRCIFCDIIYQEYQDQDRIITENTDFIAFCPFVPRFPFECWILPRKHTSQFGSLNEEKNNHLANLLREVLSRIKISLSDPSYNFYIHLAPVNQGNPGSYHWHIEIVPNLTRVAGFEWGTGFYIVRTAPHVAAKYLREAKI